MRGYTAQFGNGFSATISAEERRVTQIVEFDSVGAIVAVPTGGSIIPGNYPAGVVGAGSGLINAGAAVAPGIGAYGGFQVPDVVGNLRFDQAWGSAQVMAAYHDVNATYYSGGDGAIVGAKSAHPGDKAGWAIGGGIKLNADMIAKGDYFQAQVNYTEGAVRYVMQTPNSNWGKQDGDNLAWGVVSDAVFGGSPVLNTATGLELTTAWNVNAAYEHFWNAQWRTSVYGGYAEVSYDALANAMICVGYGGGNGAGVGSGAVATPGCNSNWSTAWVGSRTQWNVTSDFYMGVDVLYQNLNSAQTFNGLVGATGTGPSNLTSSRSTLLHVGGDEDNFAVRFRVHKDFYP